MGALLVLGLLAALAPAAASAKNLGEWTSADVNAALTQGATYLDSVADKTDPSNIHWPGAGNSGDVTDTGFALAAIGAARDADPNSVTAAQLADAKNAVQWLIKQQDTSSTSTAGSWGVSSGSSGSNYGTGVALMALSFFKDEPNAGNAINLGRTFEVKWQNAPPSVTGNAGSNCTPPSGGSYGNCGSWTYNPTCACSGDNSNTGFAVTGLDFSGGVPGPTAQANLDWVRAIQELSTNPYATLNDGGGSYLPGLTYQPFRSSANGSGSNLFELAYDGVAGSDPGVQASITFNTDVLDAYEASKSASPRQAIYHNPPSGNEDGACQVGASGCDWIVTGDGGYHYSLFAISKGLGSYIAGDVSSASNFYAKVTDLLLSEQTTDGSWPADLRDDGSSVGATAFSILALAKAGQKAAPASVSGVTYDDANGNGARDAGEQGLAGWTVYADANGNSAQDADEPSAVTASDGSYTISNIAPGTYAIREVSQSGYTCTAPAGCAYTNVTLGSGQSVTGDDFGNHRDAAPSAPPEPQPTQTACTDHRRFAFRVHHGPRSKVVKVRVYVNGKLVKTIKGKNIKKLAVVRLPQTGRFVVKIVSTHSNRSKITSTRTYRGCVKGHPTVRSTRHKRHRHRHRHRH